MATKVKPVGVAEGNWWQSAFTSASSAALSRVSSQKGFSLGKCVGLKGGDVALVTITM